MVRTPRVPDRTGLLIHIFRRPLCRGFRVRVRATLVEREAETRVENFRATLRFFFWALRRLL